MLSGSPERSTRRRGNILNGPAKSVSRLLTDSISIGPTTTPPTRLRILLTGFTSARFGRYRIAGVQATVREGHAPAVVIALEPGEQLTSEAGAMMFVSGDVEMDVEMPGGLTGGLKRSMRSGESLFLATYSARAAGAGLLLVPMTGPCHVTLQTLPFSRTARRVLEAAGGGEGERSGGGIGGMI